jgi:hypothetical protein
MATPLKTKTHTTHFMHEHTVKYGLRIMMGRDVESFNVALIREFA